MLHLRVIDTSGTVKFECSGYEIDTVYGGEYAEGDRISVSMSEGVMLGVQLDPTMSEAVICVPGRRFDYTIPFGAERASGYDPEAFSGEEHRLRAWELSDEDAYGYRNIALNPYDRHKVDKYFPHATANFVTREDPCFFERNAIDGVCHNEGHGEFPYHSWAGGAREDLEYTIDFGKEVEIDKIVFFLRADFPHDTYWKSVEVTFSDGETLTASFEGTAEGQELAFEKKKTKKVFLHDFKQVSTPLSWAALSQIEIYGQYLKEEIKAMEVRQASNAKDARHYTTERLREEFHIANLFTKDNVRMVYSHIDRIITAGLMPVFQTLQLQAGKELAANYFLERREMGCINVGGKGIITVDGTEYEMNPRDGIYIGRGNKEITFRSLDVNDPAKFYVSSCPAHTDYPIRKIDITKAKKVPCGSVEECNKRVINQYIHPEVMQSCQLSMGLTQLEPGSNWNTMPSHTHDRRMEVYFYLDMGENDIVFHMMGEPKETRHIIMHNEEAVISPSWSIHSGVGTRAYSFIWAMCGENQEFTDMDHIENKDLL
jgi:4-deoxy-L-threo-5-hexosulose-uronate ketol-isomerase